MSAISESLPIINAAPPRPGSRAGLAFALSLGVHVLFFGLLGWSLRGEERPIVIPVELVFGTLAPFQSLSSAAAPEPAAPPGAPAAPAASPAASSDMPSAAPPRSRIALATQRAAKPSFAHAPAAPQVLALATPLRPRGTADTSRPTADATLELAMHDWLRRHQRYPRAARRAGLEGTAHVRFVIDRAGALRATELVASSGHAVLDRAALDLLRRAAPYPALPYRVTAGEVELTLPVEYRLSAGATRG